ncbi:MAG: hypothetical protein IKQ61_11825 [Spirochaetales bacterium]|nr:hypothetical protein [Spirochaetales bacterium]
MAANEKYNDLGLDGLESETLLHDEDTLSGLDDLDNFDLDTDLDLNLDDVMPDEDNPSADDLDNLDNLDYSGVESDNDAAVSGDVAPIESDMSDNDIVDYPDAIDTTGEPTEAGEDLTDDDLDLSLEAGLDDDVESAPITPDISDEDIANFDSDAYDDDESDDDDDDAYGVDLKIGPVTIAFTQVVEPENNTDNEISSDDDFGDFGDADLSDGDDILEEETDLADDTDDSDNDAADTADDLEGLDELSDIGLEEASDTESEETDDNEHYDITSDDDLEFDVEQDDALSDIDIDDVLEQTGDDSGKMLNIPMPHEDELVVDEEQNAFLSDESEDILADIDIGSDSDSFADTNEPDETEEQDALTDIEDSDTDNSVADELEGFDDTIEDLSSVGAADSNLISDDDLTALEESMPADSETEAQDEELTEATLAGDVVVDEALAASIEEPADNDDEDDRIALDGDEDLGIDLDSAEIADDDNTAADTLSEDAAADDTEISLDEELPDTLEDITDADVLTEETADESDIITDEMPGDVGSLDDLDVDDIPAPTTFDDEDEDETIGLSGDELDNILVDADMSETEMVDVDIPPTDEELAESINIPDDPSFENDDEFLSDEELAASVTIPGETDISADNETTEESVVDNNIMTNGDLDLYENVDDNGSIIDNTEDAADDTKIIGDSSDNAEELSEQAIVVPASDDTLSDIDVGADMADSIDDAALETDTLETSLEPDAAADMNLDDADISAADQNTEDESETIDLASFEADLEPADGIADLGCIEDVAGEESVADIDDDAEDTKIDISEEETNQIFDSLQNEDSANDEEAAPAGETDTELKEDIKNVLTCLDSLMGALPEEKIKEFAESKEFEAYRRLFEQLDIKH